VSVKEARSFTIILFAVLAAQAGLAAPADSLTGLEQALTAREATCARKQTTNQAETLAQLKYALEKEELDRALSLLQKIAAANQTAVAQKLCCDVQSLIFGKKRALAQALVAKNPELLRKVGTACLAARCAPDLDLVAIELAEKRNALTKIDCAGVRGAVARCEQAVQFVQLWQRYLRVRTSDLVEAKARLIYLANIDISHLLIERSRLIGEIEQIPDPENRPSPPTAPSNLVDVKNDDGSSELSWTNNDQSSDSVVIEKQTLEGKWLILEELPPNVTTFHVPTPYDPLRQ
jgi:hypothetical protein